MRKRSEEVCDVVVKVESGSKAQVLRSFIGVLVMGSIKKGLPAAVNERASSSGSSGSSLDYQVCSRSCALTRWNNSQHRRGLSYSFRS